MFKKKDSVKNKIYVTKDYGKFKLLNYNRKVNTSRINTLAKNIFTNGLLNPILVTDDMHVVDGQNRLMALKKISEPVRYMYHISKNKNNLPAEISAINSSSKNWSQQDYLREWVSLGIPVYKYINNIVVREGIRINQVLKLTGIRSQISKAFKDGNLCLGAEHKHFLERNINRLNAIRYFSKSFDKFKNDNSFLVALTELIICSNYDHEKFLNKLKKCSHKIIQSANSGLYMRHFNDVINYMVHEKNRVPLPTHC